MPTTGMRNITDTILLGSADSIQIERTGPIVTLSLDKVTFSGGYAGFLKILQLPLGFRPKGTLRKNVMGATNGHQIAVYAGGSVSANVDGAYEFRDVFVYSTSDAWPTTLPGT